MGHLYQVVNLWRGCAYFNEGDNNMRFFIKKVRFYLLQKLWIFVVLVSLAIIIDIKLLPDSFRFTIGCKADEINDILLTLSFSFLASAVFYILNVWVPCYYSRKTDRQFVLKLKQSIKDSLSDATHKINPFNMNGFDEVKFVDMFANEDLNDSYPLNERYSKKDFVVGKLEVVYSCCEELLEKYSLQLTYEEMDFATSALSSFALQNALKIKDYNIPKEFRNSFDDNQKEYGESLLKLYQKSKMM